MRSVYINTVGLLLFSSCLTTAQSKKNSAACAKPEVVEATVQKTFMGRRESGGPRTEYRFVIIWKSTTPPSSFFWRPDQNTWTDVTVARPERRPGVNPNDFMVIERHVNYADIKNGDRLIITPHGHMDVEEDMPASVKKMPVSSLYYKVNKKWSYIAVKPVKRPDIILP